MRGWMRSYAPQSTHAATRRQLGDVVTLEATNREFSSVDQLVGMLNLVPAPMDDQQREALDQRRRAAAQQRAEVKRREQQREQQAFKAQAEEEAEKKRLADAKRQAQNLIEKQRREADEAQQRELDEKRKRLEQMPQEVSCSGRHQSRLTRVCAACRIQRTSRSSTRRPIAFSCTRSARSKLCLPTWTLADSAASCCAT
jgi:cation transport regulator ChaC